MFDLLAKVLAGCTVFFVLEAESAPCPSGTVDLNVTSGADINQLTQAINCTGQGTFNVKWYSSLTLSQKIDISNTKNVTVTGHGFPTVRGGLGMGESYGGTDGSGIFHVTNGSTLRLRHMVLAGGQAEHGGAVDLRSSSSLFVYGCAFENNNASNGGAIFSSTSSIFIGGNTSFEANSAFYGGAIYSPTSSIYIGGNTTFEANSAFYGGAIYAQASDIDICGNTSFENNSVDGDEAHTWPEYRPTGGALWANASTLHINGRTVFSNSTADKYAGAVYFAECEVYLGGTVNFASNVAGSYGGALRLFLSKIYVDGSTTFADNSAGLSGGAIRSSRSEVHMNGCTLFLNNSGSSGGGAIHSFGSDIYMKGMTHFVDNSAGTDGGAMLLNTGSLTLGGSTVFVDNLTRNEGAHCSDGSLIDTPTRSVLFLNNTAGGQGGAMFLTDVNTVNISDATFKGNDATLGGAMFVETPNALHVSDATFKGNEAVLGGAVYMFTVDQNETTFSSCVFEGNSAADGGALYLYTGNTVNTFVESIFRGNFARVSGGAIYHTAFLRVTNSSFVANKAGVEGPAVMSVGLVQTLSNVSFLFNNYHCRAGEYGYFVSSQEEVCESCYDEVCARCSSDGNDLSEVGDVRTNGYPVCEKPPRGSSASLSGTTVATLSLNKGYYRTANSSHAVRRCFQEKACPGGDDADMYCAPGYTGPFFYFDCPNNLPHDNILYTAYYASVTDCAVCKNGYAPAIAYSCRECSGPIGRSAMGLTICLCVAGLLSAALLFSHLGRKAHDTQEVRREVADNKGWEGKLRYCSSFLVNTLPLVAIKIVVTVWQIISQFEAIAGGVYPELYKKFVSKLTPINLDLDVVLSYSCLFTNEFYDHLVFATIAPLVVLVMLAGSYFLAMKRNSSSESAMRAVLHKHQAAVIYVAFLVYSPVSYKIFQTFACDKLDDGRTYLRADYSISCSDPRHGWYESYALLMVGVYPVGITAAFAWLLGRYRHELVKPDRDGMVHLKPLSGLWAAYKPSRYYYEVIECGRRIGLTIIAAFILPYSREQLAIALLFVVVNVFSSEVISPFKRKKDMNLYRWGNGIVVASMYVAFLMKTDVAHDETTAMLTFSGVIIAANLFMVVTVLLQTMLLVKEWRRPRDPEMAFD